MEFFGECWPTPHQEMLLNAALFTGERSISHWRQWAKSIELDNVDTASHRLLPLLYRNLNQQGVEHPDMDRYKGVYRRTWYRNQILMHKLQSVVGVLQSHQIDTMLLKGSAMILGYYIDHGVRSMNDFDVLVPVHQVRDVIDLLASSEWHTEFPTVSSRIQFTHSMLFQDAGGHDFDLHWHMMEECCLPEAEQAVWAHASPVQVGPVLTHLPHHTDHLIHTLVHGLRWEQVSPIRWVADSVTILRKAESGGVDWDRLIDRVQFCKVVVPMRLGLHYLAKKYAAPIPSDVLSNLDRISVPRREVNEFRAKAIRRTPWRRLRFHWYNYQRLRSQINTSVPIFSFLYYLQLRLGLPSLRQLPRAIAERTPGFRD